jgi:tellurite resistance protein
MQLQALVDACCDTLAAYSRYLARHPNGRNDLEAVMALPIQLWPDPFKVAFANFRQSISRGFLQLTFNTLFETIGTTGEITKERLIALAEGLESAGIGIEPDLPGATRAIKPDDPLVLFASAAPAAECRDNSAFTVGRISVELAAAVAHADGDFSDQELQHLNVYIDRWEHLKPASRLRLRAYAQLLVRSTVTLSSIKKKVELLNKPTREAIAAFAAAMVLADGVVAPEEIRVLEKIYLQLGLEKTAAYSAIHHAQAATFQPSPMPETAAIRTPPGFSLDAAKIAALKESSDRIALRLAEIFADETDDPPILQLAAAATPKANTLLGLDDAHSAFARKLMSRDSWQRAELSDIAHSLHIMLDGALEKINEASLDALDSPFTDGDDPVDINPEMNERLSQ